MRILVVGGGGREHSLCWAISASPLCTKLFCAPGNAGVAQVAECIDVAAEDIAGQVALARREKIDFVVVGPEVPLAMGLADRFTEAGIKVFGPSQKAAQLESSKGFTKELCKRHNIPTGAYERFTDAEKAAAYIKAQGAPIVVKADGLAAGKGAYSPAPIFDAAMQKRTMNEIILPTARAMAADGMPFKGVFYAGLMITAQGPKIFEYNCRFGDPECQVMMMRLKSDLVPALIACADGGLKHFDLRWSNDSALTVVMAANGYPDAYQKGTEIRGLDAAGKVEGVQIFHAGTKFGPDGKRVLANGGRVLNVTAMASTVEEARNRAYRAVDLIDWPEGFCRRDIAWRVVGSHS